MGSERSKMPRNAYFDVPPYESLVEKHPDFFIRLVMVILFSIALILCHNNLEKLGAREDVDENKGFTSPRR